MTDRLPPQDLAAEQATLGAMLIDHEAAARAFALTEAPSFYREAHRLIFDAIQAVAETGGAVDPVTVASELRRRGQLAQVGGAEYLTALIDETPTSAHVIRYASIVEEKAVKRALIKLGADLSSAAYDDPESIDDLMAMAMQRVGELAQVRVGRRGAQKASEVAGAMLARLEQAMDERPHITAARTGLPELDRMMGGLGRYGMIVPRGQEKAGKSMFGLQCALSSAVAMHEENTGQVVLCYLLEGQDVWEERALAWLGGMNSAVFTPTLSPLDDDRKRFAQAARLWRQLPLYLSSTTFDIDGIILDVRRIALRERVGLVLVDYAQLIQGGSAKSSVENAEEKANRLAALSAELHAPVIVPSQLTDGAEGRHAKWARAWDEAATLVFDVERGPIGAMREEWQSSREGRLRLHACRRRPPFGGVHWVEFDLSTGHICDAKPPEAIAGYERDQRY